MLPSPLVRLQRCPLCQYGWRVLVEQVLSLANQELVWEILGDAREEVVDHGHVTLGLLHLFLSVQHNLRRRGGVEHLSSVGANMNLILHAVL